ncbi:ABC-three component system middle component 6 [Halanaerobaculum tunisiense]
MLVPTKHENLDMNILVVGSYIVKKILNGRVLIESILEEYCKENQNPDIDIFYNALTFLYCIEAIEVSGYTVRLIER